MIEAPMSKTQTVAELILAELASTDEALSSTDFTERFALDPADNVIHRAITSLLNDGRIEAAGTKTGKRGVAVKAYRPASAAEDSDANRLMTHLEADLGTLAAADDDPMSVRLITDEDGIPTKRYPLSVILDDELDTASTSHNGDELHVIHAHLPTSAPPPVMTTATLADKHTDPIIRAIDRLCEPTWLEGGMHATRLRALASCELIANQVDVAAWLNDLAAVIEEMSV